MQQKNTCVPKKNNKKNKGCQKEANKPLGVLQTFLFEKNWWKEHRKDNWKWETKTDNDKGEKKAMDWKRGWVKKKNKFRPFMKNGRVIQNSKLRNHAKQDMFVNSFSKKKKLFLKYQKIRKQRRDISEKKELKTTSTQYTKRKENNERHDKNQINFENVKLCNVTVLSCVMCVSCVVLPQISLRYTHKKSLWEVINEESHVTPFSKTRYHSSTEEIK